MTKIIHISFLFIIVSACSSGPRKESAQDFYFPYRDLSKGAIYKFVNDGDSSDIFKWKMMEVVEGKDTVLVTEVFRNGNFKLEEQKEMLGIRGSKLLSCCFYPIDSMGEIYQSKCDVEEDSVHKWKFNPGDSCRWRVKYKEDGKPITVLRARSFTGDSVTVNCFGKDMKCMEFYDRYDLSSTVKDSSGAEKPQHTSYFILNYFARGMGLVKYKVCLPGQKPKDYRLVKVEK
ncbi:MAG TPA: hypothetical protein VI112_09865 [Bacteroidia bacterium]